MTLGGKPHQTPAAPSEETGATLVLGVIEAEMKAEEARKASIESRGTAVITTSGSLVTLLFALAALVTARDKYQAPDLALGAILIALLAFVAAAVLGLLTNAVLDYERVNLDDLQSTVTNSLGTIDVSAAQALIANSTLGIVRAARRKTNEKAKFLRYGVISEVVGVVILAIAVAIVLIDALD